jgi:topoisomerase IA-like protein
VSARNPGVPGQKMETAAKQRLKIFYLEGTMNKKPAKKTAKKKPAKKTAKKKPAKKTAKKKPAKKTAKKK